MRGVSLIWNRSMALFSAMVQMAGFGQAGMIAASCCSVSMGMAPPWDGEGDMIPRCWDLKGKQCDYDTLTVSQKRPRASRER